MMIIFEKENKEKWINVLEKEEAYAHYE